MRDILNISHINCPQRIVTGPCMEDELITVHIMVLYSRATSHYLQCSPRFIISRGVARAQCMQRVLWVYKATWRMIQPSAFFYWWSYIMTWTRLVIKHEQPINESALQIWIRLVAEVPRTNWWAVHQNGAFVACMDFNWCQGMYNYL